MTAETVKDYFEKFNNTLETFGLDRVKRGIEKK